jgi:dihydrofolate synthase/folylpolyglutamate synthase
MVNVLSSSQDRPGDSRSMRFNTLPEWLRWQEGLHFTAIELGLDRCRKVAEKMDLLRPSFTVISIAGTNGKGSCAAMLESILRQSGYRVGSYTSPHLLRYNERICIDGEEVDDAMLCRSFARIDRARGNISLTYFEFGTLAAIDLFHQGGIEIAVMEVGLGGRLDAVNMLDADVALISTIDLDHENWLGHDREHIGREKAGIFRPMRPAICADSDPPESVRTAVELVGARFFLAGREFLVESGEDGWSWRSGLNCYENLPLPGGNAYQMCNAAGVLMVLHALSERYPVETGTIFRCLRDFSLPGRFQVMNGEVPLILDVAHNRQAATVLTENLRAMADTGRTLAVAGMLADKNHGAFFTTLAPVVDTWYLASLHDDRGASSGDLAAALSAVADGTRSHVFDDVNQALDAAREEAQPGDRILVTGSFLTVGAAMRRLLPGC